MLEGFVPWPEEDVKRYKQKGYWEDVPFGEHLERWAEKYGDRPALAFKGKDISFRQMNEYATKLAYGMVLLGVKTYDRVLVQLPNVPEMVYLLYACTKIGAIPVSTLTNHRWAEITYLGKECEATVHVIQVGAKDFDFEDFAEKVQGEVPSISVVLTLGKPSRPNTVALQDLLERNVDLAVAKKELAKYRPDPMEPAFFQLSGGTTGVPKIIPRTHNDYYYNARCVAKALEYNENTRQLFVGSLMHNMPMVCCMLPIHLRGGAVVLTASFSPEGVLKAAHENKPNGLMLPNVLQHRIVDLPEEVRNQYNLSSIKHIYGTWSPNDREVDRFFALNPEWKGVNTYGMGEGLICFTRWSDPTERRHNTHGTPVSEADEIKLMDIDTKKEVKKGEIGELWTRGPYTLRGYYKSPDRNQEAFTPDGFYKSGDLVRMDEHGNVIWSGRIKDCIDRGSEKINAEEVEEHILKFEKVKEVAVVAMPDKEMGERVCVFAVSHPGQSFSLQELSDFLLNKRHIAKFKLPDRLELVDQLPVTVLGKTVDKKKLREKITEILKSEGKI